MFRNICLVLAGLLPAGTLMACDICGSGAGGGYMGLLPGFKKHFASIRYSANSLKHHVGANGNASYLTTLERFHVVEAWGATNIGDRFRIAAFVPFNFIERTGESNQVSEQGMGDISAIGYYRIWEHSTEGSPYKQVVWIGAGIKVPTGKYNTDQSTTNSTAKNTFQLGTGSVDYSIHGMYDTRYKNTGMSINAAYRFNSVNVEGYHYGNKYTTNILLYHQLKPGTKFFLSPNAGIIYESSKKDHVTHDIVAWQTGGYSLMGTLGLEAAYGPIGMGMNIQSPLSQRLGEKSLKAGKRGMLYISFSW